MQNKKILLFTLILNSIMSQANVFKEPGENGVYIIDGDTPVSSLDEIENIKTPNNFNKLIVNTLVSNALDTWKKNEAKNITYCISDRFEDKKEDIVRAMEEASIDWMDHANINYRYIPEQDFNCDENNELVTFDVRPVDFGFYLARAFFPHTNRLQRNILIDKSSFDYSYQALVGFIRHELGHTLGFRHEHIHEKAVGGCSEDKNFKSVTDYDNISVMHYPQCGGKNEILNLTLSEKDKTGARLVYPFIK